MLVKGSMMLYSMIEWFFKCIFNWKIQVVLCILYLALAISSGALFLFVNSILFFVSALLAFNHELWMEEYQRILEIEDLEEFEQACNKLFKE